MRQAERRARTLTMLREAATDAFAQRGYDATSVDNVVSVAGLSKGAVYAHFSAKLDLFLAVLDHELQEGRRRLAGPVAAIGESPTAAAARYFIDPGADRHVRLMTEAWRLALTNPEVRSRLEEFRHSATARLAHGAIDAGQTPAEALARADLVARLIDGLMVERQLERARGA